MGFPRNLKNFPEIRVFGKLNDDYPLYCDVYLNGSSVPSTTLTFQLVNITDVSYYIFDKGTATSVGTNFLTDTSKAWGVNDYAGGYLMDSSSNLYQIVSNTSDTISIVGTPEAGQYYLMPNATCFYTANSDSDQEWASFYQTTEHIIESGSKIALRGRSIRLKFYNSNADEPWELYKYQIVYEVLKHTSPNARN